MYQLDNIRDKRFVRQNSGVPEEKRILEQLKQRKLSKYGHWKSISEGMVMDVIEG